MTKRELFVFEYQNFKTKKKEINYCMTIMVKNLPKYRNWNQNVSDDDYYNTEISIYDIKMIKVIVEMN